MLSSLLYCTAILIAEVLFCDVFVEVLHSPQDLSTTSSYTDAAVAPSSLLSRFKCTLVQFVIVKDICTTSMADFHQTFFDALYKKELSLYKPMIHD